MTVITTADFASHLKRDWVYGLAAGLDLRLALDVGAAAGQLTRRIRQIGGEDMRVLAFEPFPGNLSYFAESTKDLSGVTLIEKAVSDRVGRSLFFVVSTVDGDEPGWEDMKGYSSVGRLPADTGEQRAWLWSPQRWRKLRWISTTTLDVELGDDAVVDFLKIDVEGGEHLVLAGAARLLADQRIGLMYVEWDGDPRVTDLLERNGYVAFDSHYLGGGKQQTFLDHGFETVGTFPMSTGQTGFDMMYMGGGDVSTVVRDLDNRPGMWLHTDLVIVPAGQRGEFQDRIVAL